MKTKMFLTTVLSAAALFSTTPVTEAARPDDANPPAPEPRGNGFEGIFVKVPGVPGSVDLPGHRDFVKCESFLLKPGSNGNNTFTILKRFDSASPLLARAKGEYTVRALSPVTPGG